MRFVLKYKIHATKQGVYEVMRMNFVVFVMCCNYGILHGSCLL